MAPYDLAHDALFESLRPQPADSLLSLIKAFRDDPRPSKLDLGVGVYKTAEGATPVFRAVKAAEAELIASQPTKAYLGPEGDVGFLARLAPIVLGAEPGRHLYGVQTPGGTGALRLASELLNAARPGVRVFMGTPTWPNHPQIFDKVGLTIVPYVYFDPRRQEVRFDEMMAALRTGQAGDVVLLHGCCHNPTGADLSAEQWREVAELIAARGLTPLVDLAYQGLGQGLDEDAAGLRMVVEAAADTLVAYSCDKNFGLYRERTGALFALSASERRMGLIETNIKALARANWSMPPDHGAAVVRLVLESEALTADWRAELTSMRERISSVRRALAEASPSFAAIGRQFGMFAQLDLNPEQVKRMRDEFAVYMAGSGRINVAGLTPQTAPQFVAAFEACRLDNAA